MMMGSATTDSGLSACRNVVVARSVVGKLGQSQSFGDIVSFFFGPKAAPFVQRRGTGAGAARGQTIC